MSNIRGIPGEIEVNGNIYKGAETKSATVKVNNFTKEISVNVKDDYLHEKLETKQDKLIAGEGIEINEDNEISMKGTEDALEITSNDFTIKDDKIVFSNYIANEIMSMNRTLKVDASIISKDFNQGEYIVLFNPMSIINYRDAQEYTIYEYSATNCFLFSYRTTYVLFWWYKTTNELWVDASNPTFEEDHITGFDTNWSDEIRLTSDSDLCTSIINPLKINELNTISFYDHPKLQFNANNEDELESVEFKQDGYSSDFTYTIPKGAKHYVVNELPTTDIDTTGNYYVMTESENIRSFSDTDISNLSQSEYPSTKPNTLRQNPIVNGDDFTQLQVSEAGFSGDFAIKFNIPCNVLITLKPSQPNGSYMYLDVNGVNDLLITAGHDYNYARIFNAGETLYVRGECTSAHILSYKLEIQPHTIDGKIPLSTKVDEYINFENLWFKNGGGSSVVANPTLSGDDPNLEGLNIDGRTFKIHQGQTYFAGNGIAISDSGVISLDLANADKEAF